jgi:DNA (cytosine-5)-methyltransferase 1
VKKKPTVVSLFSGCGGLDYGLKKAGFDILWANDFNSDACKSYQHNIGDIVCGDIRDLTPSITRPVDLLVGGFPCQPFSNAGSRKGVDDHRGQLYKEVFRFIELFKPRALLMENVRGLLSTKTPDGLLIDEIIDRIKGYGYHLVYRLVNFSHFGVPQNRIRVIFVAVRDANVTIGADLCVEETLKGITEESHNSNEFMRLNPQALYYGAMIPEGGSWKDISYENLPDRWKRIRDNMARYHYPNFFRRFSRKEVCGTITAAFKPENAGVWHPTESRIFSVREIARFQTFPDDFVFLGSSVKSKYQQIGNAVPPLIGERFGERLVKYLSGTKLEKMPKTNYWDAERNINKPVP